jgi:hypothetical protein
MALPYAQLKIQGYGPGHPEGSGWAMKIQGIVSLCLTGIIPPVPPTGASLVNFAVTTSSGTVNINWGDGTSNTVGSTVPVNHTFYCTSGPLGGFWSNINPCL